MSKTLSLMSAIAVTLMAIHAHDANAQQGQAQAPATTPVPVQSVAFFSPANSRISFVAVSYTHLTLPTILLV